MTQEGTSRRLVEEAKTKPLDFPPGTKFRYSNTGYLVLAEVVETAAGRPVQRVRHGDAPQARGHGARGDVRREDRSRRPRRSATRTPISGGRSSSPGRRSRPGTSPRSRASRSRRPPATPGSTRRSTTSSRGAARWTEARSCRRAEAGRGLHARARELRLRVVRRRGLEAPPVPAQRRPAGHHVRLREVPGRGPHARLPLQPRPRAPLRDRAGRHGDRPRRAVGHAGIRDGRDARPRRSSRASRASTRWRTGSG